MTASTVARRSGTAMATALATGLILTACVPNAPESAEALSVTIADDSCEVSADTAAAGPVSFVLSNTGSDVNEFYVFAEDKLRVMGEKENVTPGQQVSFVAQLDPGTYFTACKFQKVGEPIGLAEFTVTGEAIAATGDEKAQTDAAVDTYVRYIRAQTGELLPKVQEFADAYRSGDDERARELFAAARIPYERIEPTAEAFGDLDPKLDYREVDAVAEGLDWTGFHRMEKDLWAPKSGDLNSDGRDAILDWAPSTPAERAALADGLVADAERLNELVGDSGFTVTLADISNGAISLLDEVATGKISGEEDWWSHTDLTDFAANVQGAKVAFGAVSDIAASKGDDGAAVVASIDGEFTALEQALAEYGSLEAGFVPYDQVSDGERKVLSNAVNSLAEPLSQLTHTVLGVPKA